MNSETPISETHDWRRNRTFLDTLNELGTTPPFKGRFESMIFRFLFGWICDRRPGGYVYNTRMRGMVIPLYCALWKITVETSSSGIGMPLKRPMDTPK